MGYGSNCKVIVTEPEKWSISHIPPTRTKIRRMPTVTFTEAPVVLGKADVIDRTPSPPSFPFQTISPNGRTDTSSKLADVDRVSPLKLSAIRTWVSQTLWGVLSGSGTRRWPTLGQLELAGAFGSLGGTGTGAGPGPAGGCARVKPRERANFAGRWKRSSATNFVELLEFCDVPADVARMAREVTSIHLIEQDNLHDYFHVCVIKGNRRVEDHFVIGDDDLNVHVSGGVTYESRARWEAGEQALVVTSTCAQLGTEVVTVRHMDKSGDVMVLSQVARRDDSSHTVHARMVFERV
ncbi:unnamed protein product [Choristocarpus tenellus]